MSYRPVPPRPPAPPREPVPLPVVLGLGALALLWPLTGLLGLTSAMGGAPRAFLLLAVIGLVWVCVVGLGRVPRPVATLVLTGLAAGGFLLAVELVIGLTQAGPLALLATPFSAIPVVGSQVLFGLVTGLLAAAVQSARR